MNNILDIKRIGLILRADWIEYKRMFAISTGLLFVAYVFLLLQASIKTEYVFFWLGIVLTLINYFSFVKRKIHRSKGLSLTLPASTLEKFISLLIMGVCYFVVYFCVYWLAIGIDSLLTEMEIISISRIMENSTQAPGFFVFLTSYLLVCYMALRKYPVGIGFTALILFSILMIRFYYSFFSGAITTGKYAFVQSDGIYETVKFLGTYFNVAMYIASAVLLYVAYLKLKEKQIK